MIGDLDDFEVDDEDELSDWENSIETSDLDSTDDSSLENDLEVFLLNFKVIKLISLTLLISPFSLQDISILIPELSRYITNFS